MIKQLIPQCWRSNNKASSPYVWSAYLGTAIISSQDDLSEAVLSNATVIDHLTPCM